MGLVFLAMLGIGAYLFWPEIPSYQFVTVERRAITETVSVTGNTMPTSDVSLGFGTSGTVTSVYTSIGKAVRKGQVLASLDTSDLHAQIRQAEATVSTQQAKLEGLKAGSRPEDIASSQASRDKAKQDLTNMYTGIWDSSIDGYAKANDAVRVQLDEFFSNDESNNPKLTYITSSSQAQIHAEAERVSVSAALNTWQAALAEGNPSHDALEALLQANIGQLAVLRQLLNSVSQTLALPAGLTDTTIASYKANVSAALAEVNTATKNLNTITQNIASQKLTIAQLEAQLELKKAGSTPQDIAAQEAQVENALASLQSAQAKLKHAEIVSPIQGVIVTFEAKVGQYASPSTALVSIISADDFEIEAQVSEIDIGKVSIGNSVSMTLDAFPSEIFTGSVFYIDPAQTTVEGVVGYKIKVAFDTMDSRMKSGLTVNLDIATRNAQEALALPQYAILQNDDGTFVQVLETGVIKDLPVTLGLQDHEGFVEVRSGVTEGQQVINIGLKTQ